MSIKSIFPKYNEKDKGQVMMASHGEVEVKGAEAHNLRASQALIAWLSRYKVCLSLRTSMIRWTLVQINVLQLQRLSLSSQIRQGTHALLREGHVEGIDLRQF